MRTRQAERADPKGRRRQGSKPNGRDSERGMGRQPASPKAVRRNAKLSEVPYETGCHRHHSQPYEKSYGLFFV